MGQTRIAINELTNIGPTIAKRLKAIGLRTRADLEKIGAVGAYCELKLRFPDTRLLLCYYLYSLEGALRGVQWDSLGAETKDALREEAGRFVEG